MLEVTTVVSMKKRDKSNFTKLKAHRFSIRKIIELLKW